MRKGKRQGVFDSVITFRCFIVIFHGIFNDRPLHSYNSGHNPISKLYLCLALNALKVRETKSGFAFSCIYCWAQTLQKNWFYVNLQKIKIWFCYSNIVVKSLQNSKMKISRCTPWNLECYLMPNFEQWNLHRV